MKGRNSLSKKIVFRTEVQKKRILLPECKNERASALTLSDFIVLNGLLLDDSVD